MADFIMLMHSDAAERTTPEQWSAYFERLRETGAFEGGSLIGEGEAFRKNGGAAAPSDGLSGYIRIRAGSFDGAKALLAGNPVFEGGGTVEIRLLPKG